jgi:putative transposase
MKHKRNWYQRRSNRLRGYDYAGAGAYFLTIATHRYRHIFGEVVDGVMYPNEAGSVAVQCWKNIPTHFPHVLLDEFVIMPNHVHGIVIIPGEHNPDSGCIASVLGQGAAQIALLMQRPLDPMLFPDRKLPHGTSKTVGSIVRGFKIGVTKWMRSNTGIEHVWHRNYYDHIIRDHRALANIRRYIRNNPAAWTKRRSSAR